MIDRLKNEIKANEEEKADSSGSERVLGFRIHFSPTLYRLDKHNGDDIDKETLFFQCCTESTKEATSQSEAKNKMKEHEQKNTSVYDRMK